MFPPQISDALRAPPVQRLRLLKVFAAQAVWRAPLLGLVGGAVAFLAVQALAGVVGGRGIGAVGWRPLSIAIASLGVDLGMTAGLVSAAAWALRVAEQDVREWLSRLPGADGASTDSTVELDQLLGTFDELVASLYNAALGRLPLPAFLRRRVKASMRHALVDEFLTACDLGDETWPGYADVRDCLLHKGFPYGTRSTQAELRVRHLLLVGTIGGLVIGPVAVALLVYTILTAALAPLVWPVP